jgi:hypothetical protein
VDSDVLASAFVVLPEDVGGPLLVLVPASPVASAPFMAPVPSTMEWQPTIHPNAPNAQRPRTSKR